MMTSLVPASLPLLRFPSQGEVDASGGFSHRKTVGKLISQRVTPRQDVDLFTDLDFGTALALHAGDRASLSGSLGALEADGPPTSAQASPCQWRFIAKLTDYELAKLSREDWQSVSDSVERIVAEEHTLPSSSLLQALEAVLRCLECVPNVANSMLSPACLSGICTRAIAAIEGEDGAIYARLLRAASRHPQALRHLAANPSFDALCAIPAFGDILQSRTHIADLLGALTEADDVATLAALCQSSLDCASTAAYLCHFDFLTHLEPLMIDMESDTPPESLLWVISTLLSADGSLAYLTRHLASSRTLCDWLAVVSAEAPPSDVLPTLRVVRSGRAIDARATGKLAIALAGITAIAASLDAPSSKQCSALLQVLVSYPLYRPLVAHTLSMGSILPLLVRQAVASQRLSIWGLVDLVLSNAHSMARPLDLATHLSLLSDAAPSTIERIACEAISARFQLAYGAVHPMTSLARLFASSSPCDCARRPQYLRDTALCARAASGSLGRDRATSLLAWASNGSAVQQRAVSEALLALASAASSVPPISLFDPRWAPTTDYTAALKDILAACSALLSLLDTLALDLESTSVTAILRAHCTAATLGSLTLLDSMSHWAAAALQSDTLRLLRRADPIQICNAVEALTWTCPRYTLDVAELLLSLFPPPTNVDAATSWCRALMRVPGTLVALGCAPLLDRVRHLDVTSLGLAALLEDVMDEITVTTPTMVELLAFVPVERVDAPVAMHRERSGSAQGEDARTFSVKAYHGDQFRMQASEKAAPLLRPPSTHVDAFAGVPMQRRLSGSR